MKQVFSSALYKVSMHPYCLNTHNKVPYSCEFAVYVVIFGAVPDISVIGFLFHMFVSDSCANLASCESSFVLFSGDPGSV
jgi:hypothetical protein